MLITCPKCGTVYDIDAALIPDSGKNVRCAKCTQVFFVSPPLHLSSADTPEKTPFIGMPDINAPSSEDDYGFPPPDSAGGDAVPSSIDNPPSPEEIAGMLPSLPPIHKQKTPIHQSSSARTCKKKSHPFLWLLILLNVVFLGIVLWSGRYYFSLKYPVVKPFYEFFGVSFELPGFGLEFRKVKKDFSKPGFLLLSGEIVNESDKTVRVPYMKISFYNDKRVLLHSLSVAPIRDSLAPEEVMPFTVEIQSPPTTAFEVELTFMR